MANNRDRFSTIDYFITSPTLLYNASGSLTGNHSLTILPHTVVPNISNSPSKFDHSPVRLHIDMNCLKHSVVPVPPTISDHSQVSSSMRWDATKQQEYNDFLQHDPDVCALLNSTFHLEDSDAIVHVWSTIYKLVDDKLQFSTHRVREKNRHQHNKRCNAWFNEECKLDLRDLRNAEADYGRSFQRCCDIRKEYMFIVRKHKRAYHHLLLEQSVTQ